MKSEFNRQIWFMALIILFGCLIGTCIGMLIGLFLPDGVVKDFFTKTWTIIGWGDKNGWIDFNIIRFKSGFYIDISVLSLIGMMISWYFLRYFR